MRAQRERVDLLRRGMSREEQDQPGERGNEASPGPYATRCTACAPAALEA
ncbi:MAG: hypothetical protein ACRELD_07280 [Longimicrobiales bacterium]